MTGSREVTVVPTGNEGSLRNRAWIEGNRAKVEEMTDGRIGYVYLPNTGSGGYTYFNRYFFRVTGRIYLGPMVTCLIFIMVLISNTVFYLPL